MSDVHSLRIWSLKLDATATSVHLEIRPPSGHAWGTEQGATRDEILSEAYHRLYTNHHIEFITIQVECKTLASTRANSEGEV